MRKIILCLILTFITVVWTAQILLKMRGKTDSGNRNEQIFLHSAKNAEFNYSYTHYAFNILNGQVVYVTTTFVTKLDLFVPKVLSN